jgi:hypothetical protein
VEPFVPIFCLLAGSGLTLVALGMLVRRGVRQLLVASAYRDVAQKLGLQVDTRGVSIRGHLGDRRIWIGEVMEGHGTERRVEVRGVITLERPLGLGLQVRRLGRADRLLRRRRVATVPLGPEIDRALDVYGDDPTRVRDLLAGPARQALLALIGRWPDVVLTDDDVQVYLRSPSDSSSELGALVDAMVRTAAAIDLARKEVRPPDDLVAILDPWTALARSMALQIEPWMPCLTGTLDGRRVLVTAVREPDGYGTEVTLWFRPHPEIGLLLRPQIEPDGYWSVGQDIQVGNTLFDQAFVIKGYDPAGVIARLTPATRAQLLELRELGLLEVDDRGLTLRNPTLDPARLAPILRQVSAAAQALGW